MKKVLFLVFLSSCALRGRSGGCGFGPASPGQMTCQVHVREVK